MRCFLNGRAFRSLEEGYRYYHGWSSYPSWPIIDGEDAAVNTPEARGFYDRKEKENELAAKNDYGEPEPSRG